MKCHQLPPCLSRCADIVADERASKLREKMVVESFERMLKINATVFDIELAYDAICFDAVTIWVDESVLLAGEILYEYSRAVCQFGVPPCLSEDYDSYPVFTTGYDIIDEVDEILLDQQALEEDARGKNCDTCNTMGSACGGCSVTLLEDI